MVGEINIFKKKLFGGFNRQDVVDYVEKLAAERNEHLAAKNAAEDRVKLLETELSGLRAELEDCKRAMADFKVAELEEASKAISGLEAVYEDVRADIENASSRVRSELEKAESTISLISEALCQTGERLEDLRAAVDSKKARESGPEDSFNL